MAYITAITNLHCCKQCQRSKIHRYTKPPIHDLPQPTRRFGHIHVDVVGPLPPSEGKRYIFTIIDPLLAGLRPCPWRMQLPDPAPRHSLASGSPGFVSPQAANGIIERWHRTLKTTLTARCTTATWTSKLLRLLLGFRTTPNEDLAHSAAEMVYGQPLVVPREFFPNDGASDTQIEDLRRVARVLQCSPRAFKLQLERTNRLGYHRAPKASINRCHGPRRRHLHELRTPFSPSQDPRFVVLSPSLGGGTVAEATITSAPALPLRLIASVDNGAASLGILTSPHLAPAHLALHNCPYAESAGRQAWRGPRC
nr:uncharacterized protein LOC113808018 [Penaeus vannamei]